MASHGEGEHEQDAEEDGGLSARVSALSLGEEEEREGEGAGASLPRRLYLVQQETTVDVRAGASASFVEASGGSGITAAGGDDPWATVGGLERVIQEVVGCVEQASGVVKCSPYMYATKPFHHLNPISTML